MSKGEWFHLAKRDTKRVDELAALVDNLNGLNYELARDMLTEYVWIVDQMAQLKATVEKEGIVKVTYRGANNQNEIEEESKYFIAYQRLVTKSIQVAAQIKKFCKDNSTESTETDEFDEF